MFLSSAFWSFKAVNPWCEQIPSILPGAAVLYMTTYLFFGAFRSVFALVSRELKIIRESETLRQRRYSWHWFRTLKCELSPFCFGSDALAFGGPDADSSSSVQLYLKLDGQSGNTNQMINVFHLLALPGRCWHKCLKWCISVWRKQHLYVSTSFSCRVLKGFKKMEIHEMLYPQNTVILLL